MLEAPPLPLGVRVFNRLSRPVAGLIPRLSLDPHALLGAARRSSGLDDFGDPWFRQGLEVLTGALEDEAELSTLGRILTRADLVMSLENRLRLQDWRRRHPEIANEAVDRPIVIIGMARTGTTILHNLLARDRRNRVPLTWEVDPAFPPPEEATRDDDPRIVEVEQRLGRGWIGALK